MTPSTATPRLSSFSTAIRAPATISTIKAAGARGA
jgi:hypothetical protein